jgi:site-specific DNA-methyltransferase (adenine-specific)
VVVHYPEGNKFFSDEPVSEQAKQWFGWKSCNLKPAVECIIVVQKHRSEKTIVEQVLKNGCGAVNIESARIPYANEQDKASGESFNALRLGKPILSKETGWDSENNTLGTEYKATGRFPANLFVSENPLKGEETKSEMIDGSLLPPTGTKGIYGKFETLNTIRGCSDSGSPNRFYNLDRWSEKRNITLAETLEGDLSAFFDVPKPASSEKEEGLEELQEKNVRREDGSWNSLEIFSNQYTENTINPTGRGKTPKLKNFHPTTKPVLLFSYLTELFCQPKGIILDPFMGSGTTGIAALKLNKRFVGIEKEPEYFEIAKKRIEVEEKQMRLF